VAHVELSLSEPISGALDPDPTGHGDRFAGPPRSGGLSSVDEWSAATQSAHEPCLVIDNMAAVAAVSQSACSLLGFPSPTEVIGRFLYADDLLALVDFTPASAALSDADMSKIPPMLALHSGRLARGLMRVRSGADVVTMDAIATPLWDHHRVVGSLTFFSLV
jgi:hypothetical protein